MSTVSAKTYFEVEIGLTGTFTPGYPATGPTYSSGGEPGQPDMCEDVEVVSVGGVRRVTRTITFTTSGFRTTPDSMWETTDLLSGVDPQNPEVQKVLNNILTYLGDEAQEALCAEVVE